MRSFLTFALGATFGIGAVLIVLRRQKRSRRRRLDAALARTASAQAAVAVAPNAQLDKHTDEFAAHVRQVTDRVFVAIGYALANSILIVGTDGCIVVDTTESPEAARVVLEQFRPLMKNLPIRALVYTHNHTDHIAGASVFARDVRDLRVFAHSSTQRIIGEFYGPTSRTNYRRAMRQFGTLLPTGAHLNSGIGPRLVHSHASTDEFVPITDTFETKLEIHLW